MDRIDTAKEYTSNGKPVIGLELTIHNSCGDEVSYPVKGFVVVRKKPFKTEFRLWTIFGQASTLPLSALWESTKKHDLNLKQ